MATAENWGRHRWMHGDCRDPQAVAALFGDVRADLLITSPPYLKQRSYTHDLGDWSALMTLMLKAAPLTDDAQLFINLGHVHQNGEWQPYWEPWLASAKQMGWRRFQLLIWDKNEGLPGDFNGRLSPSYEFVFHLNKIRRTPHKTTPCKRAGVPFPSGSRAMTANTRRTKTAPGAPRATVASHKIARDVLSVSRQKSVRWAHPAIMPYDLAGKLIESYARDDSIVYDPFAGSGSTLIACESSGVQSLHIELSQPYRDVAEHRYQLTQQRQVNGV